jgi:hypothetical protein
MDNVANNDEAVPDDLAHLDSKTAGTVETIRGVYTHNVEQLEQHVAALVLRDLPAFLKRVATLPSEREQRAAIYVFVEDVRRTIADIGLACKFYPSGM